LVPRSAAMSCFCLRGFLTVERDDDVARLDACLRSRTWRRDLHGDHTTGAVDSQQPGDFWGQGGGLNTDIRVAGGPGGQQLVGDVDDGRGRDGETEGYRNPPSAECRPRSYLQLLLAHRSPRPQNYTGEMGGVGLD